LNKRVLVTVALAGAAVIALGLVSRSAASPARSTVIPLVRVGLPYSVPNLDQAHTNLAADVTSLSLETLLQINKSGKLEPWLATSWSQPGPSKYVYQIRKGVKFWDGNELTAQDVAASLNYYRYPGSQLAYLFPSVKTITATSKYVVTVILKHPDASFAYAPAQYAAQIFEDKFRKAEGSNFGKPGVLVMGTGPWKIDSLDPTSGAELSANPHYWGGKVNIAHISFKFFADETSEAIAFRAGALDVVPGVAAPTAFASTANTKLVSVPSCQSGWFAMNTGSAPWNDVHVRRAVAYVLNRQNIINANGGYATANYYFIPPSMLTLLGSSADVKAGLKSVPVYKTSLAKAKAEMAKSATPNGFTTELDTFAYGSFVNVNQVIAGELAQIGITATVKDVGAGQWYAEVTGAPDKRPPEYATNGCNSPDPSFYTFLLGSKNDKQGLWNLANYQPTSMDQLIDQAGAARSPKARLALYIKMEKQIATDVPYVPLFVQNGNLAISSKLAWPGYQATFYNGPWALAIQAK
jgi:peptide/nickel transport system substrate-binding protein